jgi:hypothetical protein
LSLLLFLLLVVVVVVVVVIVSSIVVSIVELFEAVLEVVVEEDLFVPLFELILALFMTYLLLIWEYYTYRLSQGDQIGVYDVKGRIGMKGKMGRISSNFLRRSGAPKPIPFSPSQ